MFFNLVMLRSLGLEVIGLLLEGYWAAIRGLLGYY